jgi:hypothetical protein
MATTNIQPPTGFDQQHIVESARSEIIHVAFAAIVTLGMLAGSGMVLWLLSALAHSSYGIYFGL